MRQRRALPPEFSISTGFTMSGAVKPAPDPAELLCQQGGALQAARKFLAAIDCYQRALVLRPHFAKAHHELGTAYERLMQLNAALECYRRALALAPDSAGTHHNLGNVLQRQHRLVEALEHYRLAVALKPNHAAAIGQIVHLRQRLCDWSEHAAMPTRRRASAMTASTSWSI